MNFKGNGTYNELLEMYRPAFTYHKHNTMEQLSIVQTIMESVWEGTNDSGGGRFLSYDESTSLLAIIPNDIVKQQIQKDLVSSTKKQKHLRLTSTSKSSSSTTQSSSMSKKKSSSTTTKKVWSYSSSSSSKSAIVDARKKKLQQRSSIIKQQRDDAAITALASTTTTDATLHVLKGIVSSSSSNEPNKQNMNSYL